MGARAIMMRSSPYSLASIFLRRISFPSSSPPSKAVLPSVSVRRSGYILSPPHPASARSSCDVVDRPDMEALRRRGCAACGRRNLRLRLHRLPHDSVHGEEGGGTTTSINGIGAWPLAGIIKEPLNADVIVKGAYGDGRHVSIDATSKAFEGQSTLNRQRMVYKSI